MLGQVLNFQSLAESVGVTGAQSKSKQKRRKQKQDSDEKRNSIGGVNLSIEERRSQNASRLQNTSGVQNDESQNDERERKKRQLDQGTMNYLKNVQNKLKESGTL